ncbi:MAG: 4a-hydroxytetrahydrobiopterin dehydratase [Balneolaceae bacterium]
MEPLKENQIIDHISDIEGWNYAEDKIFKEFHFNDFKEALAFILRVGFEAESLNHHPEIINVYNRVSIGLQTHDAGNKVSIKDIELARDIEALLV